MNSTNNSCYIIPWFQPMVDNKTHILNSNNNFFNTKPWFQPMVKENTKFNFKENIPTSIFTRTFTAFKDGFKAASDNAKSIFNTATDKAGKVSSSLVQQGKEFVDNNKLIQQGKDFVVNNKLTICVVGAAVGAGLMIDSTITLARGKAKNPTKESVKVLAAAALTAGSVYIANDPIVEKVAYVAIAAVGIYKAITAKSINTVRVFHIKTTQVQPTRREVHVRKM